MDIEQKNTDVYELITQLVKHTLEIDSSENGNLCTSPNSKLEIIRNLRSKAYEILLNKSDKIYDRENAVNSQNDPLVEILKYAFVLKTALKRTSEAEELETLINELQNQESNAEIYPILQLLLKLKSLQIKIKPVLDVFHYGKNNPLLPEDIPANNIPRFQIYPMESFLVPEHFEAMLGIHRTYNRQNISTNFVNIVSFENQYTSTVGIKPINYNSAIEMPLYKSSYIDVQSCIKERYGITHFLTHIMDDLEHKDKLYFPIRDFISNITLQSEWMKSMENPMENENDICMRTLNNITSNFTNNLEQLKEKDSVVNKDPTVIWKEIELSDNYISKLRTWESLGELEPPKETLFITDMPEARMHLTRITQTSILSLLPKKTAASVNLMYEIPFKKFLADLKLLLLGIDSDCFKYNNVTGYKLEENIMVHGITPEALVITCQEAICWGNSVKFLSCLIIPDPQTGELQQDGLIFKAMCANIKELLLYYRAALHRIFNRNEVHGLLYLFNKVRSLAHLIVEVSRLCDFNKYDCDTLHGGSSILTHIYNEVPKVTNPKVALVFYSILKSCCEVYFQLLQNWLFEGTCDDIYGEFMIQVQSQYLRERGRKFWTQSFSIDTESVPGFLRNIADSILQCGKTLRLLKICSPKNPVCDVSITAQPEIRVCLSTSMLQDQLLKCQEYERKSEVALGPIVSLLSTIQDKKKAEKDITDVVSRAQEKTLARINKQREELIIKTAQSKRDLLQALKNQAEENALFKEKEKEIEMLADKLFLERINREQQEIQEQQQIEQEHLINYYDKLAIDIQNKRIRSNWRKARMSHFEKRVKLLDSMKKFDIAISEDVITPSSKENIVDVDEQNKNIPVLFRSDISTSKKEITSRQDENSNFGKNQVLDVPAVAVSNINFTNNLLPIEISNAQSDILSKNDDENNDVEKYSFNEDTKCDEEFTTNINPVVTDTQKTDSSKQYLPLSYIHKQNNERSNFQDFLRDEATKNIQTVMNIVSTQPSESTNTHLNILKTDNMYYKKTIGVIDRPKSLAIGRIDNMTEAQANKLRVLLQEYDMTPNNNEFNTIYVNKQCQQIAACTNMIDNNNALLKEYKDTTSEENMNNNFSSTLDTKLSEGTDNKPTDNKELLSKANTKTQELISNHIQQQNADTPMSCTTDNFTTLSSHSPLSQIQNSDDIFFSADHETSSLSDTGKSITEETCFQSPASNFSLPKLFNANSNLKPITISPLTLADVEMIDHTSLQVYLEKSIIIPLQIQSRLINNAIIKYLLNEHNMLLHLHSLRSYFFLLNGEFAKSLTDSLYSCLYTISAPIELFNSATLTNLLEKALINSFSNKYVNSELLSLSVICKPCQLYISNPNVLDCLCLNYKISWPLNIILDDTTMAQYSKVFKFLIMTGRISWVLQEDFNIMKMKRNIVISNQYHKLQLYRHSMTQFMNALHNYLTCNVLHGSWNEFEKDLQNSLTIDQIYLSHMNYIKKILSRCMLNAKGEKMRECLITIFTIILKFHNRLRSQAWTIDKMGLYTHPNFKSLKHMYKSFCEWRTYMAHITHKLVTSGYEPHLAHFLDVLNINHKYNIMAKQQ